MRTPTAALLLLLLLAVGCASADDPAYLTLPERAAMNLPYSDAVRAGDLLFLAGTVGMLPGTRQLAPGGVEAETRQALRNVQANLEAHGASLDRVVKCTVFLADMNDFETMNRVYREFFTRNKPARTTVGVAALPFGARVEVDCIAQVRRAGS